jgi:hypothetical protein
MAAGVAPIAAAAHLRLHRRDHLLCLPSQVDLSECLPVAPLASALTIFLAFRTNAAYGR